jgi:prepilin-type N-terminal cleavage/methylation domain-containing protein
MQKYNHKKGFTLPEVLVAMTVLVLVVLAATNLLVSSIRSNVTNINTMVAYGLAQEGLEAVRNIRDSDWLLGANFDGTLGGRIKTNVWGVPLASVTGGVAYFTVDAKQPSALAQFRFPLNLALVMPGVSDAAPWILKTLELKDIKIGLATQLYKIDYGTPKETHYTHTRTRAGQVTPFHRYIMIDPVTYPLCPAKEARCLKKLRVASVVEWTEFGMQKQVRLDTEITDWKKAG